MAGRKRGPVYEHFQDIQSISDTNRQKKMRCLYCQEETPQSSGRLKLHLSCKCPKVPVDIKTKYAESTGVMSCKVEDVNKVEEKEKKTVPVIPAVPETSMATSKSPSLAPAATAIAKLSTVTIEQQPATMKKLSPAPTFKPLKRNGINFRAFEEQLTIAMITTNAPWGLLDHTNFRAAMEILHPTSDEFPLTSARARTEVLNRLSLKYDRECNNVLATSNAVTLVVNNTDGSAKGAKKATYIAFDEWRRAFVLAEGSEVLTAPCVTEIPSVLSNLQVVSPNSTLFLSTPTSGAYARARQELLRNADAIDNPVVLMGACMTQQTALLVHEVLLCSLSLEEALDNAVLTADALHVMPSLRQHVLCGVYTDNSAINEDINAFAQVYVTSWRSIAMAVKQAAFLEPLLRMAVFKEEVNSSSLSILRQLMDVCSSDMAWKTLRHTAQLLVPLHFISALTEMQTTTSGQLLALWIWLLGASMRSPLFDGNSDTLTASFMQRLDCYVEEHFVACLVLDPRVHGAGLSVSGLRRARGVTVRVATALISNLNENKFIRSYNDYMKQQGDFGEAGVWNAANTSNPMEFWGDYEGDPLHNQLAIVAKTLCSFVPHTCSIEELWSAHAQPSTKEASGEVSKEREKCTKIRRGAALSARVNVKDVVNRFQMLLDVEKKTTVEEMLQSNAITPAPDGQENNRNLSVRSVLESIQDGINEDARGSDASSIALDTSWFDVSSSGLDKIRHMMEKYLNVLIQQ
ncbi:unnamed protein product [Peronospora belbahrii]|uniref:BED-type domain-containing protein n=1 Tax=Peronospora belbahrii TaxID=622444 RepID=A0AAU9LBT5_9STRA|nr:unnamed protein product [Peronospora belbahrii]